MGSEAWPNFMESHQSEALGCPVGIYIMSRLFIGSMPKRTYRKIQMMGRKGGTTIAIGARTGTAQGRTTVVTLPADWVRSVNLQHGDYIVEEYETGQPTLRIRVARPGQP